METGRSIIGFSFAFAYNAHFITSKPMDYCFQPNIYFHLISSFASFYLLTSTTQNEYLAHKALTRFTNICLFFLHLLVFFEFVCFSNSHSDINIFAMDQLQCEIYLFQFSFDSPFFFSRQFIERKFLHFLVFISCVICKQE